MDLVWHLRIHSYERIGLVAGLGLVLRVCGFIGKIVRNSEIESIIKAQTQSYSQSHTKGYEDLRAEVRTALLLLFNNGEVVWDEDSHHGGHEE